MRYTILHIQRRSLLALMALVVLGTSGCGDSHPNEKQTYKIKGIVTVDGKPVADVQVGLHDAAGPDNAKPTYPQGFTREDGTVRISTYAEDDGAPVGEYKVTFLLQDYNLISRSYSGPDKLKNRYADPKTTPITVKIGPDQSNDFGSLNLTTK